ncbi:MAG TPA: GAF and ANTAR domain-containing protein [Mycobacterium sp.]
MAADEMDLAAGLRGLSEMVSSGRGVEAVLGEVANFAARAIPGVDGAGVTLIQPAGATMGIQAWEVTAPFVREIDIIQYETLQEGPCITAMQTRRAVVSGSLEADLRWPRFAGQVARLGVASVLSLPLPINDQVVGSINAYAHDVDVFDEHAVRLGSEFARPAAVSVYNTQLLVRAQQLAEQLQRALDSRGTIEQAMGIIRGRSGCSSEEAFDRLRQLSQSDNVKLAVVAQRLVDEAARRARIRNGLA